MIPTLQKSIYKHGYLILTAAWLYTASFIIINYALYKSSPAKVQVLFEHYLVEKERLFTELTLDTAALRSLISDTSKPREELFAHNQLLNFYVYTKTDGNLLLSFWNTHVVIPQHDDLIKNDGKYFSRYANGEFEFIKKTLYLDNKQIAVAALIPIRNNYFWNNKYLRTEFPALKGLSERYDLDTTNTGIVIKNEDGLALFRLKEKPKGRMMYSDYDFIPLSLRLVAVILFLVFLNFISLDVVKTRGWLNGFSFLLTVVIVLRFLSYRYHFPFNFHSLELFDELIYASNRLHPSLGDLLINTILMFWIINFLKLVSIPAINAMKPVQRKFALMVTGLLSFILLAAAFVAANLVRSLIVDSKISFDVSNFFSLSIYTLVSFIILCFIILTFFYLSHVLLLLAKKCDGVSPLAKYIFIAVAGLAYISLNFYSPALTSNLLVLFWLLLYLLLFEYREGDFQTPLMRSSFFLIWLIIFAASVASLIIFQNRNVEIEQRKRIAEKLALQTDPSGENLMNLAVTYFNNSFLSNNFYRFKSQISNKVIKDSLINENFSGYLNKYDTRIYTFDSSEIPLFNDDVASYEVIKNIINNESKKTNIPNLYYYENGLDRFSYLFEKEIKTNDGVTLGYFFIVAKPKRYKTEALYPELFKQVKDISSDLNVNYAYAVYSKNAILTNFGDHNFPSALSKKEQPALEYEVRKYGDNNELWYNAGNSKVVVIIRKGSLFYEAITLFAYLFGTFLFIIILFHIGSVLFRSRFQWRAIKAASKFSIRSQVQSTIIFISIFSFVVIGVATISFYIDRFKKTNNERLLRAITMMSSQIQSDLSGHALFDDAVKIYELGANSQLEETIANVSEIHGVDVNFYDVNGVLRISTQPYIYNKHILSEMMEPKAYYRLHFANDIKYIQNESVGKFGYVSIYVPIKDDAGQTYAYLNIPYLNSQSELNQEISNFLVTLINLNAFIFVLASAIALLLTNRITRSFSLIGDKMKEINLGKYNEEISWKSNDEIGTLVVEYNKMVKKLEESAQALAKSEREGAWREMARQVAHEIKNPLTPMKLSIQYLQRAIKEKKPGVQELAQKVSATLVEQIDQLAKIASDFSQFANIGNAKNEVFDVGDVITSLVDLHSTNETIELTWNKNKHAALVMADRLQVNRLFTNLLQNAVEACDGNEKPCITIKEEVSDDDVTLSIHDMGGGIPPEMEKRIFTPNFTTKSSGTGLGLAICKGIVEKANGKIWFITSPGEGTTFFVKLPIAKSPGIIA